MGNEGLGRLGRGKALRRAGEQGRPAKGLFELLDMAGHGWLGDAEGAGGGREAARPVDAEQRPAMIPG